jgi:hypothetical protein
MRSGLCTPAKVWVWFHHHHQHIYQNIFRITAEGDDRITAEGDTRITADSDY